MRAIGLVGRGVRQFYCQGILLLIPPFEVGGVRQAVSWLG
jgi:hypothetical protein